LYSQGEDGISTWPTWLGFSASQGGALCPQCLLTAPGAKRIAAGTVQVALLLLTKDVEVLRKLHLSAQLRREIEMTFREYLEYRLEHRLQSTRFLHDWGSVPTITGQTLSPIV
jgi:DNA repair protein RecO (recombination protein O)